MGAAIERGLYVVQVWLEADAFRADVRDVRRERGVTFTDPAVLARFLAGVPPLDAVAPTTTPADSALSLPKETA